MWRSAALQALFTASAVALAPRGGLPSRSQALATGGWRRGERASAPRSRPLRAADEGESRADTVQRLNDLFYGSGGAADAAEDVDASTQPLNALALWRVQWNALPGERQVYNVHVPHYTSLFEKLVRGPKPWYFGHLLLPGGSENLRASDYQLPDGPRATTRGTVMECLAVTRREDGTLVVVSQGVGRFDVKGVVETLPYDVVEAEWALDADETAEDAEAWRDFEFGPAGVMLTPSKASVAELSPLRPEKAPESAAPATGVDVLERRVWAALDADSALLNRALIAEGASAEEATVRPPAGLRALRPPEVDADDFVPAAPAEWPVARRASRLSFAASGALGLMEPSNGRQTLLDASSSGERLELVLAALAARAEKLRVIVAEKEAGGGGGG